MPQLGRLVPATLVATLATGTHAATVGNVVADRIAAGFDSPVYVTAAPGDTRNLYVVEQGGSIRTVDRATGALAPNPFLTIPRAEITRGGERGLLGLAFHPDYANNGQYFVNYTGPGGATHIDRVTTGGASPVREPVMRVDQPFGNHNAGWLDFGPNDGFLYISMGDGGSGNDPQNHGQRLDTPLGAMLRVDVNGDDFASDANRNYAIPASNPFVDAAGARPEIWAYGLRNPWRNSFDRETGDLYIADVGQGRFEEVNVQAASSAGGENYGWRLREGDIATPGGVGGERPPGSVDPIYRYAHGGGPFEGFSVTGGYVYRGPIEELQGLYFFADFATGEVWSFERDEDGKAINLTEWNGQLESLGADLGRISSFGEDNLGNLFVLDYDDGELFEFAAVPLPAAAWLFGPALLLLGLWRRRRR